MKFGTIKDGKFVEIKEIAEIKEPFWSSEEEREWDLKFTDPLEFKTEIVNPEALLRAIGADPGDLKNAIREEIKRTMTFIFQSNDHKARPHRKKRIAHQLNIYGQTKVDVAIKRLQTFEPPEGYYLAFSGGKDSVVIKALADLAGVKYDAHYNLTSVDPPELVAFIKEKHPDVLWEAPRDKDGTRITMWNLIPKKKMPPTRIARYCCEKLKEAGGEGRLTVTGVRWAESPRRKANQGGVTITDKKARAELEEADFSDFTQTSKGGWYSTSITKKTRRWSNFAIKEEKRL